MNITTPTPLEEESAGLHVCVRVSQSTAATSIVNTSHSNNTSFSNCKSSKPPHPSAIPHSTTATHYAFRGPPENMSQSVQQGPLLHPPPPYSSSRPAPAMAKGNHPLNGVCGWTPSRASGAHHALSIRVGREIIPSPLIAGSNGNELSFFNSRPQTAPPMTRSACTEGHQPPPSGEFNGFTASNCGPSVASRHDGNSPAMFMRSAPVPQYDYVRAAHHSTQSCFFEPPPPLVENPEERIEGRHTTGKPGTPQAHAFANAGLKANGGGGGDHISHSVSTNNQGASASNGVASRTRVAPSHSVSAPSQMTARVMTHQPYSYGNRIFKPNAPYRDHHGASNIVNSPESCQHTWPADQSLTGPTANFSSIFARATSQHLCVYSGDGPSPVPPELPSTNTVVEPSVPRQTPSLPNVQSRRDGDSVNVTRPGEPSRAPRGKQADRASRTPVDGVHSLRPTVNDGSASHPDTRAYDPPVSGPVDGSGARRWRRGNGTHSGGTGNNDNNPPPYFNQQAASHTSAQRSQAQQLLHQTGTTSDWGSGNNPTPLGQYAEEGADSKRAAHSSSMHQQHPQQFVLHGYPAFSGFHTLAGSSDRYPTSSHATGMYFEEPVSTYAGSYGMPYTNNQPSGNVASGTSSQFPSTHDFMAYGHADVVCLPPPVSSENVPPGMDGPSYRNPPSHSQRTGQWNGHFRNHASDAGSSTNANNMNTSSPDGSAVPVPGATMPGSSHGEWELHNNASCTDTNLWGRHTQHKWRGAVHAKESARQFRKKKKGRIGKEASKSKSDSAPTSPRQ